MPPAVGRKNIPNEAIMPMMAKHFAFWKWPKAGMLMKGDDYLAGWAWKVRLRFFERGAGYLTPDSSPEGQGEGITHE